MNLKLVGLKTPDESLAYSTRDTTIDHLSICYVHIQVEAGQARNAETKIPANFKH